MTGPVIYVCSFPEMAPSLNEWRTWHWTKRKSQREVFQRVYNAELNKEGNACPRGFDRVDIHAVLMYPDVRRRDSDNMGAVLKKWFQDVLVWCHIIPDDTAEHCDFHTPRIIPGAKPLTLITMELYRFPPQGGAP